MLSGFHYERFLSGCSRTTAARFGMRIPLRVVFRQPMTPDILAAIFAVSFDMHFAVARWPMARVNTTQRIGRNYSVLASEPRHRILRHSRQLLPKLQLQEY